MIRIEPGTNQAFIAPNNNIFIRTDQSAEGGGNSTNTSGDAVTTDSRSHFEFVRMQQINDRMNGTALQIRNDDRQLEQTGRLLSQMKQELYQIVKIYPPYPPGDAQRIKFLRSFNGLKQEIDRLTIPPDSKWYGKELGEDTSGYAIAATGSPGQIVPKKDALPADAQSGNGSPSPGGFDVSPLPDTASDAEIQATMNRIDKAINTVAARREQLANQAATIYQTQGQDAKTAEFSKNSSEQWNLPLPGEKAAEQKSGEVRQEVARMPENDLLGMGRRLAGLMG